LKFNEFITNDKLFEIEDIILKAELQEECMIFDNPRADLRKNTQDNSFYSADEVIQEHFITADNGGLEE
jgi:hypothetical protein